MNKKVNCVYNDQGAFCTHSKVPRSIMGVFGAKVCVEFNDDATCDLKLSKSPQYPPAAGSPTSDTLVPQLSNIQIKKLQQLCDRGGKCMSPLVEVVMPNGSICNVDKYGSCFWID